MQPKPIHPASAPSQQINAVSRTGIHRFRHGQGTPAEDLLACEAPLEIRVGFGPVTNRKVCTFATTMRTPGNDAELAIGLLLSDGIIQDVEDVLSVSDSAHSNTVRVELSPLVAFNDRHAQRLTLTNSACGICGRTELMRGAAPCQLKPVVTFQSNMISSLGEQLRRAQDVFEQTGGLHAAGLFTTAGQLALIREDIGRHNALDKLIGCCVLKCRNMGASIVVVSGRAGYELVQKCVAAGIPALAAMGAPSSLAVEMADEFDITLIGFLRPDRFNVYSGAWRLGQS